VCVGETMVAFVGSKDGADFRAVPAGAESNVAVGLARLGCRGQWVSRLGDDALGRRLEDAIGGAGVLVEVVRDDAHPTGVLVKHVAAEGARVQYYRSESAARLLSRLDLERAMASSWIHITGITPALSASAGDLVEAIVEREAGEARVSFDVNHRPVLWPDDSTAADTLSRLARRADLVFIGDDEAERLLGSSKADAVAEALLAGHHQEIVLKRGPGPATIISSDEWVTEGPLPTDVVDVVGAGDAFAAGFLAGGVFGWDARTRLRLAHFMASRVIAVHDDMVPAFTPEETGIITPDGLEALWSAPG
jgi:2-dehydro-3-deoxygluconokinase